MQAAVLAHGIAEGQSFLDGNKRVALIAMLTFLEVNGIGIDSGFRSWPTGSSASAQARRPRISPYASARPPVRSAEYARRLNS
jgi:hypothetical protein